MKILVLNSGSSSLKFQLIETSPEQIASNQDRLIAKGAVDRIGSTEAVVTYEAVGLGKTKHAKPVPEHKQAIEAAFQALTTGENKVLDNTNEIEAIGHRVVHGGEDFQTSALMTEEVVEKIENNFELAPLHNPANMRGFYASRALVPHARHVAVFDTSFHHSLPPKAFVYAIPYAYYKRDKIRRYGFHGTSHRYVSYRYAQFFEEKRDKFKLITLHLGNGCSACAIEYGRSVDTSMGFTPLEGLVMGTRSGNIDPGAVLYLLGTGEMKLHDVEVLLNRHSGLAGVSGVSNDMRDVIQEAESGNARAQLAVEIFCYQVKRYIGQYLGVMNGADAILFTGGIGENSPLIRKKACEGLENLGIQIDAARNDTAIGEAADISVADSKTHVWVIPTNEELLIARDTVRTILGIPNP